ncbi:MAG TPA: iron-containing alcohol dehydrogenase [Trebonia sp.]|jgi:alcohol dehydrogenase
MSEIGVVRLPDAVEYGWGARAALGRTVRRLGQRVFVVADPFLAGTDEFAAVLKELTAAGVSTRVYTGIEPELPVGTLTTAADVASEFAPDLVLGYGGGSALDAAKLVALLLTHGGPLSRFYGENAVPGPVIPVVAVPTTAGTGSEVTPVAVIADPDREMKVGVSSPYLIPRAAIVDPELTVGAPATVSAYAGIDALVHAAESYTARPLPHAWEPEPPVFAGRNALTEMLSLDAARRIGRSLETAVASPGDAAARSDMAYGSLVAGMAFGATGTHLCHAIQYPVGALTHTPHGLGTGLMLPYVLEVCAAAVPDRVADLGRALGVTGDPATVPGRTVERVAEIAKNIGVPASLADIGISQEQLPRIAELALASKRLVNVAPLRADADLLTRILEAAHAGDRAVLRGIEIKEAE